jgi:hypothetical protein
MDAGMSRLHLKVGAVLLVAAAASAQTPSSVASSDCSSPQHRQFDFWLGDWDVTQGDKTAGRNVIRSILNGCAISEEWTGTGGFSGNSLNFYNSTTQRWHQTWIDSRGQSLALEGQLEAGSMVLQNVAPENMPRHRITWTPMPDKSVRQLWQVRDKPEAEWRTLFDGKYSARPAVPSSATN